MLVCVFVMILDTAVMDNNSNTPSQSHHAVKFVPKICERSVGVIPTVVKTVC